MNERGWFLRVGGETDEEVEAAWDAEIKRRVAEIEAGIVKVIPAEEVFAEVRRLLR